MTACKCPINMADALKPDPESECPVCWNPYNNMFRTPKLLRCHHTFCMECLAHLSFATPMRNRLHCPLCRQVTTLRLEQAITDLPTNVAILRQLRLEPEKHGLCIGDSRRLHFFQRPPSVYTLNVGQDTGSLYSPQQTQVDTPPTTIPSDDSSGQCLRNPQFRMFSYMMLTILVISMLLIFSIFWTRKLLWGPG